MLPRSASLALALALGLAGCSIGDLPFRCDEDAACVLGGEQGVCEANGSCSFSDSECADTSRRFGDNAPEGVARKCVPACVTQLALGQFHSCALLAGGSIRCWGDARDGQLGNGKTATQSYASPVEVAGSALPAAYVSAGEDHTCAVKTPEGSVWCWGSNQGLQLGVMGAVEPGPVEVGLATPKDQPAVAVAAGLVHSCSLGSWGAKCWGAGKAGQLGSGQTPLVAPPLAEDWKADILEIGVGLAHTCGVPSVGKLRCWGNNDAGQLGLPPGQNQPVPVDVPVTAQHVAVGAGHTCALMDGRVACWGNNEQGQLGAPGPPTPKPTQVALDGDAKALAAGYAHNCAILTDGRVSCWGSNLYGQLGPSAEPGVQPGKPTVVGLPEQVDLVSAGREHSCARSVAGRVYCWGRNDYGQLGNGQSGSTEASPTPDPTVWRSLCK
jgi:alpha-tubulin suppressor-like RCC1 family protein